MRLSCRLQQEPYPHIVILFFLDTFLESKQLASYLRSPSLLEMDIWLCLQWNNCFSSLLSLSWNCMYQVSSITWQIEQRTSAVKCSISMIRVKIFVCPALHSTCIIVQISHIAKGERSLDPDTDWKVLLIAKSQPVHHVSDESRSDQCGVKGLTYVSLHIGSMKREKKSRTKIYCKFNLTSAPKEGPSLYPSSSSW